jgi:hypothetical protein
MEWLCDWLPSDEFDRLHAESSKGLVPLGDTLEGEGRITLPNGSTQRVLDDDVASLKIAEGDEADSWEFSLTGIIDHDRNDIVASCGEAE